MGEGVSPIYGKATVNYFLLGYTLLGVTKHLSEVQIYYFFQI